MLSRISYTTRACFVALILCTVNTITPQDEQPLRNRRCKCVHLGQWLQSIVSRAHGVVHASQSPEPSIPPIAETKRRLIVSSSHSPKKKSDKTPSSRFAIKRPDMSPEEELIWAYCYNSNFDNLGIALAKNPNPFSDKVFNDLQMAHFILVPNTTIPPWSISLKDYVDKYLVKHINKLAQPASTTAQEALLEVTSLPTALISIICSYTGQYQLSSNVMRYLGARIEQNIPIKAEKVLSLLPYCTDEKGNSLFYYVKQTDHNFSSLINYGIDFFNIRRDDAQYLVCGQRHRAIQQNMIRQHVNNLKKDPILFASSIESDIFFDTISDALTEPESYSLTGEVKQGESRIFEVGHFEQSDQYKLIQDYITAAPSVLAMHDTDNHSVFDHVDAACDQDSSRVRKISLLLQLFLDRQANPNMIDGQGNTFLHRVALNKDFFSFYNRPDKSPFIRQCALQLDLTIANKNGQTVFDIVELQKKDCNKQGVIGIRDHYQKFMDKLTAIQALQQVPKQPNVSKSAIAAKIVTLS